jgi:hypothetical protein
MQFPALVATYATHEDFGRELAHRGPSDRNFGWVFTLAFLFFGLWPLHHRQPIRPVFLILSGGFLLVTLLRPKLLHPANRLWTQLGILLGKVISPVFTGLLFYVVFTPAALILRWMGKDLLNLAPDPNAPTYWIARSPSQDDSGMVNQF